jgi:hypothetical protein
MHQPSSSSIEFALLSIPTFGERRCRKLAEKRNGGTHAQDRFGIGDSPIRARGSTTEQGCANGRTIGSKKHTEPS